MICGTALEEHQMSDDTDNAKLHHWGNGKIVFELFPQEYLDLDLELRSGYHPKLEFISSYGSDEIDIKLAQIAAYCEVMLDGDYTLGDRIKLCLGLRDKLILKRVYPTAQVILSIK